MRREVIIQRKKKKRHLESQAHKDAVTGQGVEPAAALDEIPATPIRPAQLQKSIADMIAESDSENVPSANKDFFADYCMYDDEAYGEENGQQILFTAGEDPNIERERQHSKLHDQIDRLNLFEHTLLGKMSNVLDIDDQMEESASTEFEATLRAMGIDESDNDLEEEMEASHGTSSSDPWWPHGSKTMFFLDLLDNLPRLRLSDDHMRAIIWAMRECGTPNVPTFSALRKFQASVTHDVLEKPEHHTSALGNHFFMNHPKKLLALDWANPLVRPHFHLYPEISALRPQKEFWQSEKWTKEVDADELSPMWADWKKSPHKHYYIKEIAELTDSKLVIPMKWVTNEGIESFLGYEVHYSSTVGATIVDNSFSPKNIQLRSFNLADPELKLFDSRQLIRNVLDIRDSWDYNMVVANEAPAWMTAAKNPLRDVAKGRPMFRLRLMPWSDDVSGNVSKQYNPHTNVYVQNLNVPHKMLAQEYFVRFCSTSSFASSSEQFEALAKDFKSNEWSEAYDCLLEQPILFQIIPHILPADNPQRSEDASHIGGNGQHNCRRDKTGGPDVEKETEDGYNSLFRDQPGEPRKKIETIETIKSQVRLACLGVREPVQTLSTQTGVKDKIATYWIEILLAKAQAAQKIRIKDISSRDHRLNDKKIGKEARKEIKESITRSIQNELWDWVLSQPEASYNKLASDDRIDPHRDTTYEMLHTWLLGPEKYIWHHSSKEWDKKYEDLFALRLESSSMDGLTIAPPRARYLIQYKNSLIGKHFKCLQQLAVFHVHGMVSNLVFDLWKASGELAALMWYPEIKDLKQYLILIDNVLDIWAMIDPSKIIKKIKLHLLSHLVEDIRRFGPPILYSTEVFECWNAIFRLCSILSNHLSPSRDIATTLADVERFKHQVSGGWWKKNGVYVQAGRCIREFLFTNHELQRRLGWADTSKARAGLVKLETQTKRCPLEWEDLPLPLQAAPRESEEMETELCSRWIHCRYIISRSHDTCKVSSWVFFSHSGAVMAGRILKILTSEGRSATPQNTRVFIQHYQIPDAPDPRLNMPMLTRTSNFYVASPLNVLFSFNAQHNCVTSGCSVVTGGASFRQERISTDIQKDFIAHANDEHYLINMHALHNAHLIRDVLPRSLSAPRPYVPDSRASRNELSVRLSISGPEKRAETQRKAQETRAKNKASKAAQRAS
ncbi:hypothetical protein H0H93_000679 [Arthromyces matolae]|nr:hypothetical protein H0H93_000679 [Arthromyces matolae]